MRFRLLLLAATVLLLAGPAPAKPLLVKGSATATAPFVAARLKLREEGLEISIDPESNSTLAIAAVGERTADLGVSTRSVTTEERATYPAQRMEERTIGVQLLSLVVSSDVWNGGVRALEKEQVRRIYEQEITNWKELGGPDHPIKFFNPEAGHGVWELLATWLYGDVRKSPLGTGFEVVSGGEETRNTVEFHAGALSVVAPAWIDSRGTFPLGIKLASGEVLPATIEAVRDKEYPLARRLSVVTADRPVGDLLKLIDFFARPAGEEFLRKAEYLPFTAATP